MVHQIRISSDVTMDGLAGYFSLPVAAAPDPTSLLGATQTSPLELGGATGVVPHADAANQFQTLLASVTTLSATVTLSTGLLQTQPESQTDSSNNTGHPVRDVAGIVHETVGASSEFVQSIAAIRGLLELNSPVNDFGQVSDAELISRILSGGHPPSASASAQTASGTVTPAPFSTVTDRPLAAISNSDAPDTTAFTDPGRDIVTVTLFGLTRENTQPVELCKEAKRGCVVTAPCEHSSISAETPDQLPTIQGGNGELLNGTATLRMLEILAGSIATEQVHADDAIDPAEQNDSFTPANYPAFYSPPIDVQPIAADAQTFNHSPLPVSAAATPPAILRDTLPTSVDVEQRSAPSQMPNTPVVVAGLHYNSPSPAKEVVPSAFPSSAKITEIPQQQSADIVTTGPIEHPSVLPDVPLVRAITEPVARPPITAAADDINEVSNAETVDSETEESPQPDISTRPLRQSVFSVVKALQSLNSRRDESNLTGSDIAEPFDASPEQSPRSHESIGVLNLLTSGKSTTTSIVAPLTTQVLTALAQNLSTVVNETPNSMTLRLDPPELGEVEVEFTRNEEGISVRVTARESVTMEMLLSRGGEIERILRAQETEIVKVEFTSPDSDARHEGTAGFTGGRSGQPGQQHQQAQDDFTFEFGAQRRAPVSGESERTEQRRRRTDSSRVRVRA